MGLIIGFGMFVGCVIGLVVTVAFGGWGIWLAIRKAKHVKRIWYVFATMLAIILIVGMIGVHEYPYESVRPGNDYGIVMKNMFLQGLGYCTVPGIAAFLAALVTFAIPQRHERKS